MVEGRRHHDVRQLDLLRLLDGSWIADPAARHGRSLRNGSVSELGVVVAGQPPGALQPSVLQSLWKAVGSGSQADLVERSGGKMGRQRRAGLQARLQSEGPLGAIHYESRRRRSPLRSDRGTRGRAVPRALRTD